MLCRPVNSSPCHLRAINFRLRQQDKLLFLPATDLKELQSRYDQNNSGHCVYPNMIDCRTLGCLVTILSIFTRAVSALLPEILKMQFRYKIIVQRSEERRVGKEWRSGGVST